MNSLRKRKKLNQLNLRPYAHKICAIVEINLYKVQTRSPLLRPEVNGAGAFRHKTLAKLREKCFSRFVFLWHRYFALQACDQAHSGSTRKQLHRHNVARKRDQVSLLVGL